MSKFDKTWLPDKAAGTLVSVAVQWLLNNPGTVSSFLMALAMAFFHWMRALGWLDRINVCIWAVCALGGVIFLFRFFWLKLKARKDDTLQQPLSPARRFLTLCLWFAALVLGVISLPRASTKTNQPISAQTEEAKPKVPVNGVGTINAPNGVVSIGQSGGQTAGTINNYPTANPKPELLQVSFSNSPFLTDDIKKRITQDLTEFRKYLLSLRLQVNISVPPIGVGDSSQLSKPLELTVQSESTSLLLPSGGRYEARIYPKQKPSTDFDQNLVLMVPELAERKAVLAIYGMYAIGQSIDRINPDPDDFFAHARSQAMTVSGVYFSGSFIGQKYVWYEPSQALWEISEKLGKHDADQLIAYALRAFSESIYRDKVRSSQSLYFYERLRDAAQLMDDRGDLDKVTAIWIKHGLDVK